MRLHSETDGPADGPAVVIVHGITQHGGVWAPLAAMLAGDGMRVVRVDIRGHGQSGHRPPWSLGTHVDDLLETVGDLGVERAAWVGHSLGGMLVAGVAARAPERVERVALLDPAMGLDPEFALMCAENDRLDWSFASVDEAVDTLLAAGFLVATPRQTLVDYAAGDLHPGPDGRLRFSFCASTAVAAWSEMTLAPPPVADVPTLLVRVQAPLFDGSAQDERYRQALGPWLTEAHVPNGHNVQWESLDEIAGLLREFLPAA